MTELKPNPIFRLMPSLTDIAFLMPVVFLFTRMQGVRTLLGDGDTGWHVRTGQWILAHHQVPYTDMFSFTMPGQPWFAWEWLWDVGAAAIFNRAGLGGVALTSFFVICVTFALLYKLIARRSQNLLVAIGLTVLAAAGSSIHWLARPHLFSMLFIVIYLSILERVREGRRKLLWWLPGLAVLWTNIHGGFVFGIAIVGLVGAGELAGAVIAATSEERWKAVRASIPYFTTALGCLAASLINPYTYHLHQHIWQYVQDPRQSAFISEFQAANFQGPAAIFFEMMLILGFGAAIWYGARRRFAEVLLLAAWAHLSLLVVRNVPIFMIVAAPLTATAVVDWLGSLSRARIAVWIQKAAELVRAASDEVAPIERLWRVHAIPVAILVLFGLAMHSPAAGTALKPEYDANAYPVGALSVLQDPALRIFTNDEWGDYLLYTRSPEGGKVFWDGRSDFYGGANVEKWLSVLGVKWDWQQTLDQYGVDTILLPPQAPLATTLKGSSRWRVVYDDGIAIVFRPAVSAAGSGERTSTRNIGGGARDLPITQPHEVSKDLVITNTGGQIKNEAVYRSFRSR
jgi:hypothetical protein